MGGDNMGYIRRTRIKGAQVYMILTPNQIMYVQEKNFFSFEDEDIWHTELHVKVNWWSIGLNFLDDLGLHGIPSIIKTL